MLKINKNYLDVDVITAATFKANLLFAINSNESFFINEQFRRKEMSFFQILKFNILFLGNDVIFYHILFKTCMIEIVV